MWNCSMGYTTSQHRLGLVRSKACTPFYYNRKKAGGSNSP